MKKICYVTTIPATLKAFVLKSAIYLHEQGGYDISFICAEDGIFERELPDFIHYYPVRMERGFSTSGFAAVREMKKIFKREKFDIVQYSTPFAALYASVAGSSAKVPVRLYCQWGVAYVGYDGWKRKVFKLAEKFICAKSTWIEPDSYGNLTMCRKDRIYSAAKSSVVWNGSAGGVDLKKFDVTYKTQWRREIREKYGLSEQQYVIGFIGRICRDKGINELFAALRELFAEKPEMTLMLVGPDEADETVDSELYRWSKTNRQVIYCGFTNQAEKYLAAMDLFVMPSYREGFGSSVIEAEAMKVPVIATDIIGPREAMKKNVTGLAVPVKNSAALRKAVERLYLNRDKGEKFGENGVRYVRERFEEQALFAKILEDRDRLLGVKRKSDHEG